MKVEKLNKSFKAIHVLRDASIELQPGERHVIIGPNGAGKTTFIHCLYGTLKFESGDVFLEGRSIKDIPSHERVRLRMARTFQKNNLFNELTVAENIKLALLSEKPYKMKLFKPLSSYKDIEQECIELLEQWDLRQRKDILVKNLSYGEQRILEIMLALCAKPKILLLDEPTSGMSPSETVRTTELIKQIPRDVTLLMIEHDMEVVFSTADKITVLHHGETIMSGTPEEISGNELLQEIYFGGGAKEHA
ncbi:ABC transporter ATP-binding protein [Niallia sp. Krafla_26]|uniref:ABC transporter ATP-binding protein n=1 Tax=Niallia sp. Krafla_26 TaxID=3064703 RepID=UPI003D1811B7